MVEEVVTLVGEIVVGAVELLGEFFAEDVAEAVIDKLGEKLDSQPDKRKAEDDQS